MTICNEGSFNMDTDIRGREFCEGNFWEIVWVFEIEGNKLVSLQTLCCQQLAWGMLFLDSKMQIFRI